jgi:hypothetical protein
MTKLDQEPSLEELSNAIDMLSSGKTSGADGIPAEVMKSTRQTY